MLSIGHLLFHALALGMTDYASEKQFYMRVLTFFENKQVFYAKTLDKIRVMYYNDYNINAKTAKKTQMEE